MVVTSDGHYIKLRADLLRCRAILYTVPGEWCIKLTSDRSPEVIISVNKKAPAFDRDGGFAALLREPTCLVGVGNPLRRDDGVGPWIVGAVREAASRANLPVVDAQDVPENFVHSIARADCRNVVFIDAVAAEGAPGTVVFGPLASFAEAESFSTHKLALSFCGRFLEAAGKKVFLLGIVPADLEFGMGLSASVESSASFLRDLIRAAAASPPG
jgi:hydrogenase 3 maturation protease